MTAKELQCMEVCYYAKTRRQIGTQKTLPQKKLDTDLTFKILGKTAAHDKVKTK